jgi:hypothetical protein
MCVDTSDWLDKAAVLIAASAWLAPWVYRKFTKPTLKGRLISHFENKGEFNSKPCLMHFLAINIISLKRSFNIKETKISVRYKGSTDSYTGTLFWARKNEWAGPNNERLTLIIKPEDTLPFVGTIPNDITKTIYLTFKVDKAELQEIDEITLTFNEQSGCSSKILISSELIDGNQTLWDDRIWQVRTT